MSGMGGLAYSNWAVWVEYLNIYLKNIIYLIQNYLKLIL
jgi:hypothetical protein